MKIVIEQDQDPMETPRGWENLGVMVCFHSRYNLGDETDLKQSMFEGWEELEAHLLRPCDEENDDLGPGVGATHVLPLYLHDRSGITMNTTGFTGGWDSGQVGFIYALEAQRVALGIAKENVEEQLRLEVQTYDQYLTGDIWGYSILDDEDDDHEVDSCWGLFGREYAEEMAEEALRDALTDSFENRMKEKSIERSMI